MSNKAVAIKKYLKDGELVEYTDCSQCTHHTWDYHINTSDEFEICTINDDVESTRNYIETELYCDGYCPYFEEL